MLAPGDGNTGSRSIIEKERREAAPPWLCNVTDMFDRLVSIGFVLIALWPVAAESQISGVVMTSTGVPLEGVAVEAWGAGRRLVATLTDAQGAFLLADSTVANADEIRAGALGFRTRTVPVRAGVRSYEIVLAEEPLLIAGLEVVMEGDICLRQEDRGARGLWDHARTRYHQALDTLGIATYLSEADTIVPRDRIGPLRLPDLALSQRSSGSILRFSWDRRVQRDGYAFKVRRTDGEAAYDSWVYAPLEADFASHFSGMTFGDRHRFVEAVEEFDGWSVTFCPREEDLPSIRGTIVLAPDTTITSVEWSFRTADPYERAGGRATFAPVTGPPEESYLLPTEALIWHQVPDGRYFQRYQRYEGWTVVPGDSVPQLPLRRTSTSARRPG